MLFIGFLKLISSLIFLPKNNFMANKDHILRQQEGYDLFDENIYGPFKKPSRGDIFLDWVANMVIPIILVGFGIVVGLFIIASFIAQ